jgi:hypothetical protein
MLVLALLACHGGGQEHAAAALAEPPVLVAAATTPLLAPAATGGGQVEALVGTAGPSSSSSALAAPAAAPADPLLAIGEQLFSMGDIFSDLPKNIRDLLPNDLGAKAVDCVKRMVSVFNRLPTEGYTQGGRFWMKGRRDQELEGTRNTKLSQVQGARCVIPYVL